MHLQLEPRCVGGPLGICPRKWAQKAPKKSFRMREDSRQTNVFGMYFLRVLDAARCLTADSYSSSRAVLDAVHH